MNKFTAEWANRLRISPRFSVPRHFVGWHAADLVDFVAACDAVILEHHLGGSLPPPEGLSSVRADAVTVLAAFQENAA